jgi:hypothetical protein
MEHKQMAQRPATQSKPVESHQQARGAFQFTGISAKAGKEPDFKTSAAKLSLAEKKKKLKEHIL